MITLKLLDSIGDIEIKVNKAISEQVNKLLSNKQSLLISKAKSLCVNWINSQPEIQSLFSSNVDSLAGQFGFPPEIGPSIVNSIETSIQNSISAKFIKYNNKLTSGGLEIYFQPNNFSNLLSLSDGHVIYEGGDLHWLNWLLTAGDTIIVANYQYNPISGLGRSGLGNMTSGGSFRVPPQYSGTIDNNFVTRALTSSQAYDDIKKLFQEILS